MATTTSVLGLTKPAYSESADVSVINSDMDLIDAEAGRARGNIAADYSASQAYAVGDLCLYTGVLYRCKTAIGSGGEAWNSGHWDAVKIAGQLSALSDQIAKYHAGTDTAVYLQERYLSKAFSPDYLSGKTPNQFAVCVTPLGDAAQPGDERWFVTKGNGGFTVLCRTVGSLTSESTRDFDYIVQII